jgi:alpha-galactosidase
VQYNTWFSWFCELDEETLLREADIAAELGVELFYVDAGWWVGNPVRQDRFSSGLGNWTENRDKFPSGLRAFADGIRQRGMHFGIWVEPERVDLRTASTGTWRPEWLVTNGGRYAGPDWPSDTDTAWLCYGHRPTIEWAKAWIGDLVQSLDVRWLKWDSNFWQVCTNPEHDHGTGDGESAQLAGVYEVMAELRQRFPDLIIENCAGGGTRMDYALAGETHVAWLNDATEPMHRSRFHSAGAAYLFPSEMNNAWVSESDYEKIGGLALTEPVIRASVRSRMLGALGFSCRLIEWTPNERRIVHEEIARYRRAIRPIMATGRFSHLLPQPEIDSATMSTPHAWEAYGITSSDRSRAVVLAFRNKATASTLPLRLPGLDPDATYDITYDDGQVRSATGSVITSEGITAECLPLESVVVEFSRH